jgi:alpha-methylacyl-CoA racemase
MTANLVDKSDSNGRPLDGIRVIDLTRLAPGPYCTMLLADMGAEIIVVGGGAGSLPIQALARGKRFIELDLKSSEGKAAFGGLVRQSDVLLEGYRPGVMDRLGLGYESLHQVNPRLIYCALTGYGQSGPLSQEAGHDLNYAAISGALGAFGPAGDVPSFPLNILADFAGGSLFATIGILQALVMRERTKMGQYIDAAMVDGCISLMAMHYPDWKQPVLRGPGDGLVAGNAPFYRCYRCADGRFIAVAALEQRFFANLWQVLGYKEALPNHLDRATWPSMTERLIRQFATRTRDEWTDAFLGKDACVTPVLDPIEALTHEQNLSRHPDLRPDRVPVVPVLSEAAQSALPTDLSDKTKHVLGDLGLWSDTLEQAIRDKPRTVVTGLKWPPL